MDEVRQDVGEDARKFVGRLSAKQRRLLLAMPVRGSKKWRVLYRHAKVAVANRDFAQLPFRLAHPTLTGSEVLTPLGREVRALISAERREPTHPTLPEQLPEDGVTIGEEG